MTSIEICGETYHLDARVAPMAHRTAQRRAQQVAGMCYSDARADATVVGWLVVRIERSLVGHRVRVWGGAGTYAHGHTMPLAGATP